jgi:hypothetical protein
LYDLSSLSFSFLLFFFSVFIITGLVLLVAKVPSPTVRAIRSVLIAPHRPTARCLVYNAVSAVRENLSNSVSSFTFLFLFVLFFHSAFPHLFFLLCFLFFFQIKVNWNVSIAQGSSCFFLSASYSFFMPSPPLILLLFSSFLLLLPVLGSHRPSSSSFSFLPLLIQW